MFSFTTLSLACRPAKRASLSCSMTQCIRRFLKPGLSLTCCEENFPSLSNISFMQSKAIDIAIINMPMMKVSAIFQYFCGKDSANRAKRKINERETSFYFTFKHASHTWDTNAANTEKPSADTENINKKQY